MTFKEIEKTFDEKFKFLGCGLCLKGTWLDPRDFRGTDWYPNAPEPKNAQEELKSYIHSTLDKYVKELIGEDEPTKGTWKTDTSSLSQINSWRNQLRSELLKQHKKNIK